jgi:hypothetical protein
VRDGFVRRATAQPLLLVLVVAGLFVAISAPVVIRGAPLADDFNNCLAPDQQGLGTFLSSSGERLGALRTTRFIEILVATGVCQNLHFGFAIAVPLILTLAIVLLLRGLLQDLGIRSPWPDIGAALWLLQPLGAEAALWPAAIHVPLGLALALTALRLYRRGHLGWASVACLGSCLSVEQVILALPVAVWVTAGPVHRRQALAATLVVVGLVLTSFFLWRGTDPRLRPSAGERISTAFSDPAFYAEYPAVGLGIHSIPLAVAWAFPASLVALGAGGTVGWWWGQVALKPGTRPAPARSTRNTVLIGLTLVALLNLPVAFTVPHQGSPRLFTPTWLVLAGVAAVLGSSIRWRRRGLAGAIAGICAAAALLSLAFSVSVRLASADFVENASRLLAARTQEGDSIAMCDIRRTVVEPAPRGAFAIHDFLYDWAAQDAIYFYTGRTAEFRLAGEVLGSHCPPRDEVDILVMFPDLLAETEKE